MKKYIVFLLFTGVVLVATVSAMAATVTYNGGLTGQSFDPFPDSIGSVPLHLDGSIALAQFDPGLGILNSVNIGFSSIFNYLTQFENKSPSSGYRYRELQQKLDGWSF